MKPRGIMRGEKARKRLAKRKIKAAKAVRYAKAVEKRLADEVDAKILTGIAEAV